MPLFRKGQWPCQRPEDLQEGPGAISADHWFPVGFSLYVYIQKGRCHACVCVCVCMCPFYYYRAGCAKLCIQKMQFAHPVAFLLNYFLTQLRIQNYSNKAPTCTPKNFWCMGTTKVRKCKCNNSQLWTHNAKRPPCHWSCLIPFSTF